MSNFIFIIAFSFSRNARIKKSIKLFSVFFGVFSIKGTGCKGLLILCLLGRALGLYVPVPAFFVLRAGAGYGVVTVGTVSRVRMVIAGVLGAGRLVLCRGGVWG